MEGIKLKFCPFCGKGAKIVHRVNKRGVVVYAIECKNCNSKSDWYDDSERSARSWNARVTGFTKGKG